MPGPKMLLEAYKGEKRVGGEREREREKNRGRVGSSVKAPHCWLISSGSSGLLTLFVAADRCESKEFHIGFPHAPHHTTPSSPVLLPPPSPLMTLSASAWAMKFTVGKI